jgi:hypothetical protein
MDDSIAPSRTSTGSRRLSETVKLLYPPAEPDRLSEEPLDGIETVPAVLPAINTKDTKDAKDRNENARQDEPKGTRDTKEGRAKRLSGARVC